MAELVVTVNDRDLIHGIRTMITLGSDVRPAFERIGDDFLQMEAEQFATDGGRGGEPWKPLSPAWAERKRSEQILIWRSHRLERSLTQRRARGARRRIEIRPGRMSSIEMGSTHPLAHLHQRGTADRWVTSQGGKPLVRPRYAGRLPARPMVVVTERDKQRWRGILADHLFSAGWRMGL